MLLYLIAAVLVMPEGTPASLSTIWRFVTEDIVPYPLRGADLLDATV